MSSSTMVENSLLSFRWYALPADIKFAIMHSNTFSKDDVRACASVDRQMYDICLPLLFRTVKLSSREALTSFVENVPTRYLTYIHELVICTKPKHAIIDLAADQSDVGYEITNKLVYILSHTTLLTRLSLSIGGSLDNFILPTFGTLTGVHSFALSNWSDETMAPLSERLAMAMVLSLPSLHDLSLTRITRSACYAPELVGSHVPIVLNDDAVPYPLSLGQNHQVELRLPTLLTLQHLRRLRIRETHLGDPAWAIQPIPISSVLSTDDQPELELLDLGTSPYEPPSFNDKCTQRILSRAPTRSLRSVSLSTGPPVSPTSSASQTSCPPSPLGSVSPSSFSGLPPTPEEQEPEVHAPSFPSLRTLHLTPLVPPELLPSTLTQPALSCSPVHTLSCAFDPADAAEGIRAVESFLWERGCNVSGISTGRSRTGSVSGLAKNASAPLRRRSTMSSSTPYSSALYPSLQTLSISLCPASPPPTPKSYSAKLAARIQARLVREATEREEAARSLVKCCRALGVSAEVSGIDIGVISEEEEDDMDAIPVEKATITVQTTLSGRVRANST